MNFENLNGLLEDNFQLSTFCSYLKNGEDKGFKGLNVFESILDAYDPEDINDTYDALSEEQIDEIINDNSLLGNTNVTILNGFTTLKDAALDFNNGFCDYMNGSISNIDDILISLKDAANNTIDSVRYSDFIDNIKNDIGASILQRAAIEGAAEENIADRIAKFEAIASNSININSSIFSNSVNYFKTMLTNKLSGIDIINKVFNDSGATDLSNGNAVTISEYDINNYAGCSPLGSFSWNTTKDIINATGKIIGTTCKVIADGLGKVGKWIFGKVKKYTTEVFQNPYDIVDNGNTNTNYCFNGFQYQMTGVQNTVRFIYDEDHELVSRMSQLTTLLLNNANSWYFFKTIGGEMAVKYSSISFNQGVDDYWYLNAEFDLVVKPYSLIEINNLADYDPSVGLSTEDYLTHMNSLTGDRYLSTNVDEHDLLNSFLNGLQVHWNILSSYYLAAFNLPGRVFANNFSHYASNSVTNKDVFEVATGIYENSPNEFVYRYCPKALHAYNINTGTYGANADISSIGILFIALLSQLKLQNDVMSNNYDYYVPYMHDDFNLSEGRFGIKTDSQNQNLANAIAGALIIIVAVVSVIVIGKIVINKIQKHLFWKRTEFIAGCDNAMWSGRTLTPSYRRKYIRYQRKQNASNILTKGITDELIDNSSSTISTLYNNIAGDKDNASISSILKLIQGDV